MRISDWSSDVCSSDLAAGRDVARLDLDVGPGVRATQLARLPVRLARLGRDVQLAGDPLQRVREEVVPAGEVPAAEQVAIAEVQIGSAACRERGCQYG